MLRTGGIRGITVKLDFKDIKLDGEFLELDAGVLLPKVSRVALENSLEGFEFAAGIPGTVGGAIKMNARGLWAER